MVFSLGVLIQFLGTNRIGRSDSCMYVQRDNGVYYFVIAGEVSGIFSNLQELFRFCKTARSYVLVGGWCPDFVSFGCHRTLASRICLRSHWLSPMTSIPSVRIELKIGASSTSDSE